MRRIWSAALLGTAVTARAGVAQAPDLADLWRVAAATLSGPAALERGPTGSFWNPAAVLDHAGLAGGVEVLQTPDVVAVSGVMGGVTLRLGARVGVGVLAGRVSVEDLIRTTTSPISELGEIPVYAQLVGVAAAVGGDRIAIGSSLRLHDSRFDATDDAGVTWDVGFRLTPVARLTVAGASRFAPVGLDDDRAADYGIAAEYGVTTTTVWGARTLVLGRYGVTHRPGAGLEHGIGAGAEFARHLRVDVGWTREQGFGVATWRSVIAVALRAGPYVVAIARGAGLNGVGASFRLSLNAGVAR